MHCRGREYAGAGINERIAVGFVLSAELVLGAHAGFVPADTAPGSLDTGCELLRLLYLIRAHSFSEIQYELFPAGGRAGCGEARHRGDDRPHGAAPRAQGGRIVEFGPRIRALRVALVLTGLAFGVGVPLFTRMWPAQWMWEPRQSEYEQMIVGIYVTLGFFVLLAARDPLRHLSLIWFTAWSSLVHGGIMLVQALVDHAERPNLMGDIPALILVGVALAVLTPRARDLPPPAAGASPR